MLRCGNRPQFIMGSTKVRPTNWAQEYFDTWGKPPGVPLTPEEFAEREPIWSERVRRLAEG